MNTRPITVGDIDSLNLSEQWMRDRYRTYIEADVGPAWIVEDEKGVLCAFGAAVYWNGMWCGGAEGNVNGLCEVWYILIDKRKILSQMKEIKKHLSEQPKKYGVHRLQAVTKKGFEAGVRLFEFLGFKCETPDGMKKYFPDGATGLLYSKVM